MKFFVNIFLSVLSFKDVTILLFIGLFFKSQKRELNYYGNILVICPDNKIGDNLLATSFIKSLKLSFPEKKIHLLYSPLTQNIYENNIYVDYFHKLNINLYSSYKNILFRRKILKNFCRNEFKNINFEIAITPRWDEDQFSPFISWYSNARNRYSFSEKVNFIKSFRNFFTDHLYTRTFLCDGSIHECLKSNFLLEKIFNINLDKSLITTYINVDNISKDKFFELRSSFKDIWLININTSSKRRNWSYESLVIVLNNLDIILKRRLLVCYIGSEHDSKTAELINSGLILKNITFINLCGKLSFPEISLLASYSKVFIGGDSGLGHLCSTNSNDLTFFIISCHHTSASSCHSNSPTRFAPYTKNLFVIRPPHPLSNKCINGCVSNNSHCINLVSPDFLLYSLISNLTLSDIFIS